MTEIQQADVLTGEVVEHRTPDEWAEVIRADLARSVEGVLAAGRHLVEAKADIEPGYWELWIQDELRLHPTYIRRLIAISNHPIISRREYTLALPASPETLYHLSRLDPSALQQAIEAGDVHPQLQQKQAKQLAAEYRIRETGNGSKVHAAAVDGKVGTIVADPPWRYGNTSTRGAAQDHYPTMSVEDICDLKVAHNHTGEQAHLYLWTTAGHLPQAFDVMEAWGFTYKTYLVWVKTQMGMGNYFRVSTELVLFGIKGELRTRERNILNWFEARRGKHSAKPESFYDMVMTASPGPYLEMFARCRKEQQLICGCSRCRLGWEVWGNET